MKAMARDIVYGGFPLLQSMKFDSSTKGQIELEGRLTSDISDLVSYMILHESLWAWPWLF